MLNDVEAGKLAIKAALRTAGSNEFNLESSIVSILFLFLKL
jgi:hypothetical protein